MTGKKLSAKGWLCNHSDLMSLVLVFVISALVTSCQTKKVDFLNADAVQLAPPSIQVDSSLFMDSATVRVRLGETGSVIRYSLDDSPVTETSVEYDKPIRISHTARLRVRAFHPQFVASGEQSASVRKMAQDISDAIVALEQQPNVSYPGKGASSLVDGQKGGLNFRKGSYWLGFQDSIVRITMRFDKDVKADKIVLSTLQDQDSWVFAPQSIEITSNGKKMGSKKLEQSAIAGKKQLQYIEIPITTDNNQEFTISIHPLQKIPDWHPGKGTLPWTFIDEIMLE